MPELSDKQRYQVWSEYVENIRKQTALLTGETEATQKKRIKILEADPELWFKYYFPQYCYASPAPFHISATKRIMANPEWYEVRNWSRELAKDVRTMMEILFLMLTGKKRYMLMISNSYDNAEKFLAPYWGNLEANQRIIHDYGVQELPGSWTSGDFVSRKGFGFLALGAGQSPRGTRLEEARPDVLVFNDIDTDEECRNADIIENKWKWIESAAIGTRSVSKATLILFLGNIIAEDCCVVRATKNADYVHVVNIRDENGRSSWPEKNSEEQIDRVLSKVSYSAQQREYYNNPIDDGKVFKELTYGKCPPLKSLPFVVVYADPAPSNRDKPGVKAKAQNSCKAVAICGSQDDILFVYKVFVDTTTNSNFIDWLYRSRDYINDRTQGYFYIENNTLQNPFYEQVLLPLILSKGQEPGNTVLGITPDDRDKPDKYFRIEGNLEPKNRLGMMILNIDEKDDPHMQRLEAQFKSVSPNSKTMDGPDAVEGAWHIIKTKITVLGNGAGNLVKRPKNTRRY
ncbi:MAG: hypothetical protein J0M30_14790 [Chitinophagales bacterium]|nr:hypothetical protein [Chitinophagales bacterium]